MDTGRIGVRFDDREAFGAFCLALKGKGVPFSLAGNQTVILTAEAYDRLNGDMPTRGVSVWPVTRGDKHTKLPSRGETESKLWKYAKPR